MGTESRLPGQKIAVLGLGVSGFESARFLQGQGCDVWVSDASDSPALQERAEALRAQGVQVELGVHSLKSIFEQDAVVISPGIPPTSEICQALKKKNIPIISEIELASRYTKTPLVIAVTGTCGKTTTCTLLTQLLIASGRKAICCGNIGNPWISEVDKLSPDHVVVVEVSSFQLEYCSTFRPDIGILLNVSRNHEDWHADFDEYVRAKLRLFDHQTSEDHAIIPREDREALFPSYDFKSHILEFDKKSKEPQRVVLEKMSELLEIEEEKVTGILDGFDGLEHRLEKFLDNEGVVFINDSKSTTTASLKWALDKQPNKNIILIAGGRAKSDDFDSLIEQIQNKVKAGLLIGESQELIESAWKDSTRVIRKQGLEEAVESALEIAESGDVVLLSPACASFDQFKNYIDRGNQFKQIVERLVGVSCNE